MTSGYSKTVEAFLKVCVRARVCVCMCVCVCVCMCVSDHAVSIKFPEFVVDVGIQLTAENDVSML